MVRKILIIGPIHTSKALKRAIFNIETINRSLIRFLYSPIFADKISLCEVQDADNNLRKGQDIKLIIFSIGNVDDGTILKRIRLGEFGESIARIPMIILSVNPFAEFKTSLIFYHIKQHGAFLEIPFSFDVFQQILETVNFLNEDQLLNIKSDNIIFCEIINSKNHGITDKNYEEEALNIIRIAEMCFPGKYTSKLDIVQKILQKIKSGQKGISDLTDILTELEEEVKRDGKQGKTPDFMCR